MKFSRFMLLPLYLPSGIFPDPEIQCLELLRDLPGKRRVYAGRWAGQDIVAKVFLPGARVARYWQREEKGIKAMLRRGILTPEILYSGSLAGQAGFIIILPFIDHSLTASHLWSQAGSDQERYKLLSQLLDTLASHHQAGIVQRDLHLGNFLVAGEKVYTLDGSDITVYEKSVGPQKSLNNLGLFFAQFSPKYDGLAEKSLRLYCQSRKFVYSKNLLQKLKKRIEIQRRKRRNKILQKIFRECSAVVARQVDGKRMLCARNYFTEPMTDFLLEPERYLEGKNVELLKDGNSSTVMRLNIGALDLVIKRYNIKNFSHGIKHAMMRTRASRSWENAHLLGFYGIRTAQPVAMVENRRGSVSRTSYFISEYVKGITCVDFFETHHYYGGEKEMEAKKLVALLLQLQELHISHGDLKASNIVMTQDGPVLLDLDAMCQYRTAARFKKAGKRDLQRFLLNWENNPEVYGMFIRQLKNEGLCP